MLIDTHAHLNFAAFKNDLAEVIKRSLAENVWVINIGSKYETSKRAVEIAERYGEGIFAAIGLHPIYSTAGIVKIRTRPAKAGQNLDSLRNKYILELKTDPEEGDFVAKEEDFDKEKYKELANSEKVVAIGEIGLDYYYRPKTKKKLELFKEKQRTVLCKQLELAKELNLPVIFHCRMAHDDLLEILRNIRGVQGVIHCFTGNWAKAKIFLEMGFYLGFNGIIYKLDLKEIIEKTPLEKILIETDCPYLVPLKVNAERNEPIFLKYIAQDIAKIKNVDYQKVAETTTQNARKLFGI